MALAESGGTAKLTVCVSVMAVVFCVTMFVVKPNWGEVLQGVIPTVPGGAIMTCVALIGTTVVPYNLFIHATSSHQTWKDPEQIPLAEFDVRCSMVIGGFITGAVMITAGTVMRGMGVNSAIDMAAQLEPLLGNLSVPFLAIGLICAGISSAVITPLGVSYVLAGLFGWKLDRSDKRYFFTNIAIVLCGIVGTATGFNPLTIIMAAQAVNGVDLTLRRGEKVAIIGPNGCGKSTLLKTILQELPPLKGEARIGNRVKIGYFSQSYERLDENQTIMENFLTEYGLTDEQTRRLLGSMMFHGEDVFKVIGTLSGGQKARLVLLKLVLDGANCLLLDEPTNHLDIAAKEAVEAALETFDGTVLLVSHDRYLVNEVAGRIWAVEDGHVTDYKGNYDFYLEERDKNRSQEAAPEILRKEKEPAAKATPATAAPQTAQPEKKMEKKPEKKPYSPAEAQKLLPQVELKIREYEALQKVLSDKIADPSNQQDLETSTKLAEEYAEQSKILDGLMDKWEKLMESLE